MMRKGHRDILESRNVIPPAPLDLDGDHHRGLYMYVYIKFNQAVLTLKVCAL